MNPAELLKDRILDCTVDYFRISKEDLKGSACKRPFVMARCAFVYCMHKYGFKDRETCEYIGKDRSQCTYYRLKVRDNEYELQDHVEIILGKISSYGSHTQLTKTASKIFNTLIVEDMRLRKQNLSVGYKTIAKRSVMYAQALLEEIHKATI